MIARRWALTKAYARWDRGSPFEGIETDFLRGVAGAAWFQGSITGVVLLGGVLVGIETCPWTRSASRCCISRISFVC